MEQGYDIVLASSSPRRRELLSRAGVAFRVYAVDVDEGLEPALLAQPVEAVKKLAERKAHAAVEHLLAPGYEGALVVLGSDTMVVSGGEIFGKPQDASDARRMLRALSGQGHDVHTAVSIWFVHASEGDAPEVAHRTLVDTTRVYFKELSESQIDAYIASGDPFDKAGAYGIQSGAKPFIDHIEGSLDTVVGMPVERLLREYPDVFGDERPGV